MLARGDLEECEIVVDSLPGERKASIVARLPTVRIRQLLDSARHRPAEWLVDAPFDDAVTLLSRIPRDRVLALVESIDDRDRQRQLLRHLQYPAHTVGALVVDIPLRLTADSPAKDAVEELRELDTDSKGPIVIVDEGGRYLGILDRWQLLLRSPPTGQIKDYKVAVRAIRPETQVTDIAMIDEWHTRNWLPVVDHRDRVLGAVSREKVLRTSSAYSRNTDGHGDVLVDLLADVVYLAEALLLKTISRKDAA